MTYDPFESPRKQPTPGEEQESTPVPAEPEPAALPRVESAPREEEQAESPAPTDSAIFETPPGQKCSIIGATQAGKTFLLAALHQACQLSGEDGYRLTFTSRDEGRPPGEPRTSDLVRSIIRRIILNDPTVLRATATTATYSFQVNCRALAWKEPWWWIQDTLPFGRHAKNGATRRGRDIIFELVDGPGEALLARDRITPDKENWEYRKALVSHLRQASTLVVCVDSTVPQLELFAAGFPELLGEAAGATGTLYANRVLLLLTKIDQLVEEFLLGARSTLRLLQQTEYPTVALRALGGRTVKPRSLALSLDPVETARAILGRAAVSAIRRALRWDAEMAIGVCSSTGFYSDGTSFWLSGADSGPRLRRGATWDDVYRNWSPFGVKEAVLYLITGRCGATVSNYTSREDMKSADRRSHSVQLLYEPGNEPEALEWDKEER